MMTIMNKNNNGYITKHNSGLPRRTASSSWELTLDALALIPRPGPVVRVRRFPRG